MGRADADPRAIREFAKQLEQFERETREASRRLRSQFGRTDWNDSEGRRFEQKVNDLLKSVERPLQQAGSLGATAKKKAGQLEAYLGR
jgi:hypothetical protein